jgi:hypothetical protein
MTLDMREAPLLRLCFFALPCCPFQRLSITLLTSLICILLFISPSHPSPPHTVLRHVTCPSKPHGAFSALAELQEKWAVESCGGSIEGIVAPATRSPSGPSPIYQSPGKRLYRHSRTARPSHWLAVVAEARTGVCRPAQISLASATHARLLPATPPPTAT